MSNEANKNLVTAFWQAFSESRYDDALAMMAEDATWWVAGTTALSGTYSKPEFANLLSQVTPQAPDGIKITIKQLTAEDNRVSMEADSYGEITNGKTYQNIYHFMLEIADGKKAIWF